MTNYKFRWSSLVSSKWFHKLVKNMNTPRKKHQPPTSYSLNTTTKKKNSSSESNSLTHSSRSYVSNRLHTSLEPKALQNSPRNSIQSKRKCVYKPSPTSTSSVSAGLNRNKIKFLPAQDSTSASSNLKLGSSANDIIFDMKNRTLKKVIVKETKVLGSMKKGFPASNRTEETLKLHHLSVKVNSKEKLQEEDACRNQKRHQKPLVSNGRRSSENSPGIKLRVNSPRIQVSPRRSISRLQSKQVLDGFAVIKSSSDPRKDFSESMVEMIEQNNIRTSKDLEDLLACYLTLNHKEYHDLIIKVFIQVWLEVIKSTLASN